jgi:cytochrome c553
MTQIRFLKLREVWVRGIAANLSEDEMRELAAYFSSAPKGAKK